MKPNVYKAPSMQALIQCLNITPEKAALVRALIRGEKSTRDASTFPRSNAHFKACHHEPKRMDRVMQCLNEALELYGVECIGEVRTYGPPAEYLNMGDTYACTIIWDHITDTFKLSSWGDWLEKNEGKSAFRNW